MSQRTPSRRTDEIYVIDPLLCTECVGFHDYEACAAVCPVDCCVTDPNNVESEEALIVRAREIHTDTDFGDDLRIPVPAEATEPPPRPRPPSGRPTPRRSPQLRHRRPPPRRGSPREPRLRVP